MAHILRIQRAKLTFIRLMSDGDGFSLIDVSCSSTRPFRFRSKFVGFCSKTIFAANPRFRWIHMHLSETDHHCSKGLFTASLQADVKSMVERYGHTTAPILCKFLGKKKKKIRRTFESPWYGHGIFMYMENSGYSIESFFFLYLSSTSLSVWIIFVNCWKFFS